MSERNQAEVTREKWMKLLKLSILGFLVMWAYQRGLLQDAMKALSAVSVVDGLSAMLALGITLLFGVARWRLILKSLNFPQPTWGLGLRLYYEGLFYNTLAPGAIGGDLLRAHWLRERDDRDSKIHYFVTLGERVMGLGTLGILGLYAWFGPLASFAYTAFAILVVFSLPPLIKHLKTHWPSQLQLVPDELKRAPLFAAIALNTVSHAISFMIYIFLGQSLGLVLPLSTWFEVLSITVLAANLPLSVAGIGPREFALLTLLAQQGVSEEKALAISMGALATLILHALIGGLVHALLPTTRGVE